MPLVTAKKYHNLDIKRKKCAVKTFKHSKKLLFLRKQSSFECENCKENVKKENNFWISCEIASF